MLTTLVIGISLFTFGVYMIGPWYQIIPGGAAFGELSITSGLYFKAVAGCYVASGLGMIYAGIKGQNTYTRIATVMSFSMFTIMVVTRLITIGLVPTIWIFQLALLLITAILALTTGDE